MPLPDATLESQVDAELADLFAGAPARQAVFFGNNGRYWEGRRVMVLTPTDGALVATNTGAKQTDCPSWSAAGVTIPATMRCAVEVLAYQAPGGQHGWVAIAWVRCQGGIYRRSRNFAGPETWRTHAWELVA